MESKMSLLGTHSPLSLFPSLLTYHTHLSLTPRPKLKLTITSGGGPRTYPGGVSKWQWKRMQNKKSKQLLKARLSRERQVYEMRKRAELRAAVSELEKPWEVVERAPNLFSVRADEQLKTLADRFVKVGGFDLWTERDGPELFKRGDDVDGAVLKTERFLPEGSVHSVRPYRSVSEGEKEEGLCGLESGRKIGFRRRVRKSEKLVGEVSEKDEGFEISREEEEEGGDVEGLIDVDRRRRRKSKPENLAEEISRKYESLSLEGFEFSSEDEERGDVEALFDVDRRRGRKSGNLIEQVSETDNFSFEDFGFSSTEEEDGDVDALLNVDRRKLQGRTYQVNSDQTTFNSYRYRSDERVVAKKGLGSKDNIRTYQQNVRAVRPYGLESEYGTLGAREETFEYASDKRVVIREGLSGKVSRKLGHGRNGAGSSYGRLKKDGVFDREVIEDSFSHSNGERVVKNIRGRFGLGYSKNATLHAKRFGFANENEEEDLYTRNFRGDSRNVKGENTHRIGLERSTSDKYMRLGHGRDERVVSREGSSGQDSGRSFHGGTSGKGYSGETFRSNRRGGSVGTINSYRQRYDPRGEVDFTRERRSQYGSEEKAEERDDFGNVIRKQTSRNNYRGRREMGEHDGTFRGRGRTVNWTEDKLNVLDRGSKDKNYGNRRGRCSSNACWSDGSGVSRKSRGAHTGQVYDMTPRQDGRYEM